MSGQEAGTKGAGEGRGSRVRAFYSSHPISAAHILFQAKAARGTLDGLRPEDLFPFDQDHYGGLEAVDALIAAARISEGASVLDVCSGLAGPARYVAHTCGARVVGIDINPDRVAGAVDLTRRVGLAGQVTIVRGDAMQLPFPAGSFDAVYSQEALLHVPDKSAVVREVARVLRPGGRFAFTDWIEHRDLAADDRDLLWRGMAAQFLASVGRYRDWLGTSGFEVERVDDLTEEWGPILDQRFAMYRRLRESAGAAGHPAGDDAFYASYRLLVDRVIDRSLGGARFVARMAGTPSAAAAGAP